MLLKLIYVYFISRKSQRKLIFEHCDKSTVPMEDEHVTIAHE